MCERDILMAVSNKTIYAITLTGILVIAILFFIPIGGGNGEGPWTWIGDVDIPGFSDKPDSSSTLPSPSSSNAPWSLFTPVPTTTAPQPSNGQTPTSPTTQPTVPPMDKPSKPSISGHVWQTLYVSEKSGHSYWYNAKNPYIAQTIYGKESSYTEFNVIASINNAIYMKINTDKPVESYTFRCDETIYVTRGTQNYIIVNQAPIDIHKTNFKNNANVEITGSVMTAAQLQVLLNSAGVPNNYVGIGVPVPAMFSISLNHIEVDIHYADGQTVTIKTTSSDVSNVLSWQIMLIN